MAHNQQQPYGSQNPDTAGSTQMFQAFVNDGGTPLNGPAAPAAPSSGPRVGLIVGVVAAVAVIAVVVFLALG
ncbi:hypothetical protein [Streptomyces avicenniae]|uniref:hypothetical protein n=1 Tax=Streptomyces avicenniae TaxID=500153 RepID=UPI00069A97F9|nr:hypothetical protein [Streptomyces avicenniae]